MNYTIRAGDNLTTIARRFGVSIATIANANHIDDPDVIRTGDVLVIPAMGATPTTYDNALTPVTLTPRPLHAIPGTGGPVLTLADWFKPPRLYFLLAALAAGAYVFNRKR